MAIGFRSVAQYLIYDMGFRTWLKRAMESSRSLTSLGFRFLINKIEFLY